jgi:putative ABC transport system permease protein
MWLRYLKLSIRNVMRSRARSLLTMGAIAFGVLMTLVLGAFIAGLGNVMVDDAIKSRVGALQIHRKGYDDVHENQPLDLDIPADAPWIAEIGDIEGVTAVAPRLVFGGILSNGSSSANYVGIGVDPVLDRKAMPWKDHGLHGALVGDDPTKTSATVLGHELARALGVKPGDTLTLQAATAHGQQNAMDVELVGTLDSGTPFEGKRLLQVPLAYAQSLLDMDGRYTEIVVAVDDRDAIDAVARRVRALVGPDYEVQPWHELRPQIADIVRMQKIILGGIGAVFLVIAIIGVINTMLMSVLERTREIGTMMAVGVRRRTITLLFLFEGLALAVFGGALGVGLAALLVRLAAGAGGFDVSPPGNESVMQIIPALPAWLLLPTVAATLVGTLCAAAWPAYRASQMKPVDALRAT